MPVRYAPGKRTIANLKWRLTLLIVLSPFLYFLGKVILSMFIAPASGFVMLDIQRYQSSVSGVVRELYVEVGKQVKKNDLLAVLQNHDLEAKIEEVTLLLNLPATEMQTEDSTTEAYLLNQINLAEEALEHQQKRYNDIDFLFKQGAATLSEQASAH